MEPPISPPLFAVLLLCGMLILLETGRRVGMKRLPKESEGERGSLGTIEGAVFALFGLVMAFSFSGAASRFNEKRMLIAEEVNTIETAYLRLHLVAQPARPDLQELFRRYVDSRLETYRQLPNMQSAEKEMAKSKKIQDEIWRDAVAATLLPTFSSRRRKTPSSRAQQHDRHQYNSHNGTADSPTEGCLCAFVRPRSHLFAVGGLSNGNWSTPELASHLWFHSDHRYRRIRHP